MPVKTSRDGRYMVFETNGEGTFYIIKDKHHFRPYMIAVGAAAAVLLLIVIANILKKLPKKEKVVKK